ncbi:MAG: tRNA (adenosine(37)-N6)-threonylcarbamoyltransferase complex ATPase subunit type 1 TsaE [Oscillospiraceae bacterium]
MKEFVSKNLKDTEKIADSIRKLLKSNSIIALQGDVGSGKTTFTSSLLRSMGYENIVTSPTFSIVHQYKLANFSVAHFDMYRISSLQDLYSIGFYDYLDNHLLIIEWSENIMSEIPEDAIFINIIKIDETTRKFKITGVNL